MPPTLFIKNGLRLSELGLGDGTVYASGSSAAPNPAQKTFALTGTTPIANLGAIVDDIFNGYILRFPASGNIYHIVDYVAGTATITTYEAPASGDTGAFEIRRALVCNKQLAGNPAHRLADGQRFADWKAATNNSVQVHLPNLIDNGGFETNAVAPWVKSTSGGTADTSGIISASPILGSYHLQIAIGDRTNVIYAQPTRTIMRKGRTYRIIFKARAAGAAFADGKFSVQFFYKTANLAFSVAWANNSGGTTSATAWFPTLTGSNAWCGIDVIPAADIPAGSRLALVLASAPAFTVQIDEVYLWEKVSVSALQVWDPASSFNLTALVGHYTAGDRTGITVAVDYNQIVGSTFYAAADVVNIEFAAQVYPVFLIHFADLIQASEILLAQKWVWGRHVLQPFDPELIEKEESIFRSRSGVESSVVHSRRRRYKGRVRLLNDTDRDIWKNDWYPYHHDPRHPFAVQIDSSRPIVLMNDDEAAFGLEYDSVRPARNFNWVEVVK